MAAGEFSVLYSAHAQDKVEVKVPVFTAKEEPVVGLPQVEWEMTEIVSPTHKARPLRARALYVRPVARTREAEPESGDGSRGNPFSSVEAAVAAATEGCEILLLEGRYGPMTLASAPRSITLRGAAGAEVVLSGDTGARGFRGLWWHSGVSTKPLLTITNCPLMTVADLQLEYAFVGLHVTNSPEFQLLNCTFRDVKRPLDGDGLSLRNVTLEPANAVAFTSRLTRLTDVRLPWGAALAAYAVGHGYVIVCTAVVIVRSDELSRSLLAQWSLQVLLSLLLDFALLQPLTALCLFALLHLLLRAPAPGRSRYLPPQLRSRTLRLLGWATAPAGSPAPRPPTIDDAPLPSRTGAWRQWFGRPASKGTPATPAAAYREGPPPPERAASPLSPARLGSFRKPPPPPEPTGSGWA
eukprot:EG_transcript_9266